MLEEEDGLLEAVSRGELGQTVLVSSTLTTHYTHEVVVVCWSQQQILLSLNITSPLLPVAPGTHQGSHRPTSRLSSRDW